MVYFNKFFSSFSKNGCVFNRILRFHWKVILRHFFIYRCIKIAPANGKSWAKFSFIFKSTYKIVLGKDSIL